MASRNQREHRYCFYCFLLKDSPNRCSFFIHNIFMSMMIMMKSNCVTSILLTCLINSYLEPIHIGNIFKMNYSCSTISCDDFGLHINFFYKQLVSIGCLYQLCILLSCVLFFTKLKVRRIKITTYTEIISMLTNRL